MEVIQVFRIQYSDWVMKRNTLHITFLGMYSVFCDWIHFRSNLPNTENDQLGTNTKKIHLITGAAICLSSRTVTLAELSVLSGARVGQIKRGRASVKYPEKFYTQNLILKIPWHENVTFWGFLTLVWVPLAYLYSTSRNFVGCKMSTRHSAPPLKKQSSDVGLGKNIDSSVHCNLFVLDSISIKNFF